MAAKQETTFDPRDAIRKGWLAYIGMYGTAYDRANEIFNGRVSDLFEDFVAKGEEVETRTQETVEDIRGRAKDFYAERLNLEGLRNLVPSRNKGRVEELEAEIAALKKKVAAKTRTKRAAAKKTTKAAAAE